MNKKIKKLVPFLIVIMTIILIFYFLSSSTSIKEGFDWTKKEKDIFLNITKTSTPNKIYDLNTFEKYVNPFELYHFFSFNRWPWSDQISDRYKKALLKNPYIRREAKDGLNEVQKNYPEKTMEYILNEQESYEEERLKRENQLKKERINSLPSGLGMFGINAGLT
jgi:hypothetical protein